MHAKTLLITSVVSVALLSLAAGCGESRKSLPEDGITKLFPQPLQYAEWWNARYVGSAPTPFGTWGAPCSIGDAACKSELDRLRSEYTDPAQHRTGTLCSPPRTGSPRGEQENCFGFLLVTTSSGPTVLRHPEEVAEWLKPIDSLDKLAVLLQTTSYLWRLLNARRVGEGWGMTVSDAHGEIADYEICVSRDGVIRDSHPSCD